MRPRSPFTTGRGGFCHIGFTVRSACIEPTAGWCRNWPPGTMCADCCLWSGKHSPKARSDRDSIDAVAYTAGPGLIGALLVGAGFAAGLSLAWGKPGAADSSLGRSSAGAAARAQSARLSVSSLCWYREAIRSSSMWRASALTGYWAKPWMMRPARPSTRPRNCSVCLTRAAPPWPRSRKKAAASASRFRVPCWTGRVWISVSVA